jgi:hypothetical protein
MRRARPTLGVRLLLTAALIVSAASLVQALRLGPRYRHADVIAEYDEHRMNEVRALLAPYGSVEYRIDDPPGVPGALASGYLTQYVVVPAVVVERTQRPRLLLDGRPDSAPPNDPRPLILEHDAGNGVRLYRAEGP